MAASAKHALYRRILPALHLLFIYWLVFSEDDAYDLETLMAMIWREPEGYATSLRPGSLFAMITLSAEPACATPETCWDTAIFMPDPEVEPHGITGTLWRATERPVRSPPADLDTSVGQVGATSSHAPPTALTASPARETAGTEDVKLWTVEQEKQGALDHPALLAIIPLGDITHLGMSHAELAGDESYPGYVHDVLSNMLEHDADRLRSSTSNELQRAWAALAAQELLAAHVLLCGRGTEADGGQSVSRLQEEMGQFALEGIEKRASKEGDVAWYELVRWSQSCTQ